jgi:hypothetical protein
MKLHPPTAGEPYSRSAFMNRNHQNLLGIQLDPIRTRDFQVETLRADADEKPDAGPKADYHGPDDPAHRAVHDVTEHLLGSRVTSASTSAQRF